MRIVAQVYLAETVLPALRGALSTVLQLSVALGFVISFALGISMSYKHMAIVGAGIGGMYTLMLFAIPETPRWYLRHCQPKKVGSKLLPGSMSQCFTWHTAMM